MKMQNRRNVIKGGMASGVAVLAGAGLASRPVGAYADDTVKPKKGGVLRAAIIGGTVSDSLDAHNAINQADVYRVLALYDGLVTLAADGSVVNALADTMEPNATATSWTIRVKKEAVFHDGKPVTAKDVAFTFARITNPKAPMVGALGLAPLDLNSIQYLDDKTMRIPMKTPYSCLREAIAFPMAAGIVPVGYDPAKPIGAGPLKFKSMTPAQQTELVRFDEYWKGPSLLDGVTIVESFGNNTAAFNALQGGQVDAFVNAPSQLVKQIAANTALKALVSGPGGFIPFTMRTDKPPFNDPNVRQAMRLLVDRKQFVKLAFSGFAAEAYDIYGQWDPAFDSALKREQDIDQAKFLLKKAGQESLQFELPTADLTNGYLTMAQIFAQQARKAGVTVTLNQMPADTFYNNYYTKATFAQDYFYYTPIMGVPPISILPGAFYNETGWSDPEYMQIYAQAQQAVAFSARRELIQKMQQIEFARGPYIIPTYNCAADLLATNVMGLPAARTGYGLGNFEITNAWLA